MMVLIGVRVKNLRRKIKGFYEGRQYISVDGGDTFTPTNNIIISKNKKRFEEMLQERMRT